jgi:hypothetical protein
MAATLMFDLWVPDYFLRITRTQLRINPSGGAAAVTLAIDGIDRTAALGGPWSAPAILDITQYLIDVRLKPLAGAHPVVISSATDGVIDVAGDFYPVVKAVG